MPKMAPGPRIPTQPLVDYVKRRGGPSEFYDRSAEATTPGGSDYRTNLIWKRAGGAKTINVWDVDWFCITVLGVHPTAVYGDVWWEWEVDVPDDEFDSYDELVAA